MENKEVVMPEVVEENPSPKKNNKKQKKEAGKGLTITAGILLGIALIIGVIMLSINVQGILDSITGEAEGGADALGKGIGAILVAILLIGLVLILAATCLILTLVGMSFAIRNLKHHPTKGLLIANIIYLVIVVGNFAMILGKIIPFIGA